MDLECRICTKLRKPYHLKELFECDQKKLKQIEELTGLLLENVKDLPRFICTTCQRDLQQAYRFRERCLKAQEHYTAAKYKKLSKQTSITKRNANRAQKKKNVEKEQNNCNTKDNLETKVELETFLKVELETNADLDSDNNGDFQSETEGYYPPTPDELRMLIDEKKVSTRIDYSSLKREKESSEERNVLKLNKKWKPSSEIKNECKTKKKHKSVKKEANNFICDQCGNHFTCRHHFLTHQRRHTGDKRFQCEICPDKFFTHSELNRHMRRHTGERPFACQHCGRRFTDYSTRIKHERTHTNERPFVCPHCSKAFTTSYILKNHILTHTGERSFQCLLCNRSFQRQTHLVVHYRSIMHKQNEEKQRNANNELTDGTPIVHEQMATATVVV